MTMYDKDFVEAAIPLLWDHTATVQVAREDGMPGSPADPRKAQDPLVRMIDVRRAWDQCEWLDLELKQAMFAYAAVGTRRAAAFILGIDEHTVIRRHERGLELMTIWLNSTFADRERWMKDLEEVEKYGRINPLREREILDAG